MRIQKKQGWTWLLGNFQRGEVKMKKEYLNIPEEINEAVGKLINIKDYLSNNKAREQIQGAIDTLIGEYNAVGQEGN